MGLIRIKKVPTAEEIIQAYPLSESVRQEIAQHKLEIEAILSNKDKRLLIIVGPCSAWPDVAVLEYAKRLKQLSDKVKDKLKLVIRVYTQKPRTVKGWSGSMNQPNPLAKPDIALGIKYCRKLMVDVVSLGLPIADECLFTHNAGGFQELLSWVALGARSSEDFEHRVFASSLECPVGLKNPTHGALNIAVNSVVAAQHTHYMVLDGYEVETSGNPYAHLVLRGGNGKPNYDLESIATVWQLFQKWQVSNPAIIIDASHDNCLLNGVKDHNAQAPIILQIIQELKTKPELQQVVKGFMLESFIKGGAQNPSMVQELDYDGLSITDPCLDWSATEKLLLEIAAKHQC